MFVLDRLISRSSRSLAVMIGSARGRKGGGGENLRGSPDDAAQLLQVFFPLRRPPIPRNDR